MTEVDSRARLVVIVGVLVVALFAGLLTRLWFLQVTGGEKLAVAAQRQRDRIVAGAGVARRRSSTQGLACWPRPCW